MRHIDWKVDTFLIAVGTILLAIATKNFWLGLAIFLLANGLRKWPSEYK